MASGPLIPGLEEFDAPRRGIPRWILLTIGVIAASAVFLLILGFVAGAGPLRGLGLQTQTLQPIAFRPTANPLVVQVAVGMPVEGICKGDSVTARAIEDGDVVVLNAEFTRLRNSNCGTTGVGSNVAWIDVALDEPLAERSIIRGSDRLPLSQRTALS